MRKLLLEAVVLSCCRKASLERSLSCQLLAIALEAGSTFAGSGSPASFRGYGRGPPRRAFAGVPSSRQAHGAFKSASVKTFAAINDALVWSEDIHLQGYEKRKLPLAVVGEQTPSIVSILQFCLTAEHHDLLPGLSMHSSPCSTPPTPQTADTWGGRAVSSPGGHGGSGYDGG